MIGHVRILEIRFEPEHYNRVCGCTIPEGWWADVEADTGRGYERLPKWIGGSPEDIVESLKREFRHVTGSHGIHKLVTNTKGE